MTPWITKGIKKSSKRKQRLYDNYLKKRTFESEKKYKDYKNLFERIKKNSKKNYYHGLFNKYVNNIKKTWQTMKEIIGRSKVYNKNSLPRKIFVNNLEIEDQNEIANNFNDFFVSIGPKLASKIPQASTNFLSYLKTINKQIQLYEITDEEFILAFSTLKRNKASGFDDITSNIVHSVYEEIKLPFKHICNVSVMTGVFPDHLKIARVIPVFKNGDESLLSNYRPISILPCFSKILERIIYNRLFDFLTENNILYSSQFGFQKRHSTEHAFVDLVDQINDNFKANKLTLGIFLDLSKAFDTVDHSILLKKMEAYGITGKTLDLFTSYLSNRLQYISYENKSTDMLEVKCGVPQGSILGPLLFLIYVNDLANVSSLLKPIMFADDTNLFFSHKNIKTLFETVNHELIKIAEWLKANKLSLNVDKTTYTLFHKPRFKDNIPLRLPNIFIENKSIKQANATKFLGIIIDENLNWDHHLLFLENKISKNLGIIYRAKPFVNENSLKCLYYSFINSYLQYGNIVWGSTYKTKLKKLFSIQKRAIRAVFNIDYNNSATEIMKTQNILNVYQLNLYQIAIFMFNFKNEKLPKAFCNRFQIIRNRYNTRSSSKNFREPYSHLQLVKFSISHRGPKIWNNLVNDSLKDQTNLSYFKNKLKYDILNIINTDDYF